jgi:hypothetical protein
MRVVAERGEPRGDSEADAAECESAVASRYVASLDELWWQLGPAEQDEVERELQASVEVGVEPNLVDSPVVEGTSDLPRRAA